MAAAEIQVVNPENLQRIESFFNDSAYREAIENSASFNTRLCVERRLRMPFLDPQTGVAQTHCNLLMSIRQRMPGAREGQLYTYPAARWRKARRQYLSFHSRSRWGPWGGGIGEGVSGDGFGGEGDVSMDAHDTDSKDSHHARDGMMLKDDLPKEWFYDDMGMDDMEPYDEKKPDSDEDYCDDSYSSRRRKGASAAQASGSGPTKGKRRGGGHAASQNISDGVLKEGEPVAPPKGRGRGGGRGRKKAVQQTLPYEVAGDADKPFGCELCGVRYKTRPGLTYHYTHSHKEGNSTGGATPASAGSDGDSRDTTQQSQKDISTVGSAATVTPVGAASTPPPASGAVDAGAAAGLATEYQDSYVTFLNKPAGAAGVPSSNAPRGSRPPTAAVPPSAVSEEGAAPVDPPSPAPGTADDDASRSSDPSASPKRGPGGKQQSSPYCDFCLGDHRQNKKTGIPEELFSCSDCGRSGKFARRNINNNDKRKVNRENGPRDHKLKTNCAVVLSRETRGRKKSQSDRKDAAVPVSKSNGISKNILKTESNVNREIKVTNEISTRTANNLSHNSRDCSPVRDEDPPRITSYPADDFDRFADMHLSECGRRTSWGRSESEDSRSAGAGSPPPELPEEAIGPLRKSPRKNSASLVTVPVKRTRRK